VLLALVAGIAVVVALVVSGHHAGKRNSSSGGGGGSTVTLRGVTGYDPQGTGGEHNGDAPKATDGNLATFWSTETYATADFGNLKSGVGLVLDAGSAVTLHHLTVQTGTPGFSARIQAGNSPSGPFSDDSSDETVGASTTFDLNGATARYYVIWITMLTPAGVAHVNEATAS
jgi:putative peptidoglycan lipid II flippase